MAQLHELLAVEKGLLTQLSVLTADTAGKFQKEQFFKGHNKTLKMIADSPENQALEVSNTEFKALPTTVVETLEYYAEHWAKAEDIIFRKNKTNQSAASDLYFGGAVIAREVPVDELLGLEVRLTNLRGMLTQMPTLDASKVWDADTSTGRTAWKARNPDVTTKTEKKTTPVVLYEATDKHPAQIKEINQDVVVGTNTTISYSGAATSLQKAQVLRNVDELIGEVKKARMRANTSVAVEDSIGDTLISRILAPLNEQSTNVGVR
jgi:hypothetical protein